MYKTTFFLLLILTVFHCTITSTDAKNANPDIVLTQKYHRLKEHFAEIWEKDKHKAIVESIEMMADLYGTLTLVAVEDVYREDGVIDRVRSFSLQIPQKPEADQHAGALIALVEEDRLGQEIDNNNGIIPRTTEVFANMHGLRQEIVLKYFFFDLPISATLECQDKWETAKRFYYSDSDNHYFKSKDGFAVYNKFVRNADPEEVKEAINKAKDNKNGQVGYLQYDEDEHQFVDSQLAPVLQGQLVEHYDATNRMIAEGPRIISKVQTKFPKSEIPEQLAVAFTKSFPEYKWRTIPKSASSYINKDLSITLANHNFNFYANDNKLQYMVFGIKVDGSG